MRRFNIKDFAIAAAAVLAAALTVGTPAAAAGPTGYRAVDLGTLGGEQSTAVAVNDLGHVVGNSQIADGSWHGYLWRHGTMTDLGAFQPTGINNRDEVIGSFDWATSALLWRDGKLTDLGTLGGPLNFPAGINDRGQVVGMSSTADDNDVPFLWTAGRMRALPLDTATNINNRSEISGMVADSDGVHAAVYRHGTVVALGAGPQDRSTTQAINNLGWVVGWKWSTTDDNAQAALWRHNVRTDLGALSGTFSAPLAINDRGEILGVFGDGPGGSERPFRWRAGVMTDLSAYGIETAADLNVKGEICGTIGLRAMLFQPI